MLRSLRNRATVVALLALLSFPTAVSAQEPDTTPPTITGASHVSDDVIEVVFSEAIRCPTLEFHGSLKYGTPGLWDAYPETWTCAADRMQLTYNTGIVPPGYDGWLSYAGYTGWITDSAGNELGDVEHFLIDRTGHPPAGQLVYAVDTEGQLSTFDSGNAHEPTSTTALHRADGQAVNVTSIDFRPADGALYAVTRGQLSTIDTATGLLTPVADGEGIVPGDRFEVDPEADSAVAAQFSDLYEQSLDTGRVADPNPPNMSYDDPAVDTDGIRIWAMASTAPDIDPQTSSRLLAFEQDQLVEIHDSTPPTLHRLDIEVPEVAGFDISPAGEAWVLYDADLMPRIARLDLETGELSGSDFLGADREMVDIAIPLPAPGEDLDAPAIRSARYAGADSGAELVEVTFDEPITCDEDAPPAPLFRLSRPANKLADRIDVDAISLTGCDGDAQVTVGLPAGHFFSGDIDYRLAFSPGPETAVFSDTAGHPAPAMTTPVHVTGAPPREPFVDVLDLSLAEGETGTIPLALSRPAWAATPVRAFPDDDSETATFWSERANAEGEVAQGADTGGLLVTLPDDREVEPPETYVLQSVVQPWLGTLRRQGTVTILDDDKDRPEILTATVIAADQTAMRIALQYDEPVTCRSSFDTGQVHLVAEGLAPNDPRGKATAIESCDGDDTVVLRYPPGGLLRDQEVMLRVTAWDSERTFVQDAAADPEDADAAEPMGVMLDTSGPFLPPAEVSIIDATMSEGGPFCQPVYMVFDTTVDEEEFRLEYRTIEGTALESDGTFHEDYRGDFWARSGWSEAGVTRTDSNLAPPHEYKTTFCRLEDDDVSERTEQFQIQIRGDGVEVDDTATITVLDDDTPQVDLAASPSVADVGDRVVLTAGLLGGEPVGLGPLAGEPITIERLSGGSWTPVTSGTTAGDGDLVYPVTARASTVYRARYSGDFGPGTATSSRVTVGVRSVLTAEWVDTRVQAGDTAVLRGRTMPAHPNTDLVIQRRIDGSWRNVARPSTDSRGRFRFAVTLRRQTVRSYRVVLPGHDDHLRGVSPAARLTVTG